MADGEALADRAERIALPALRLFQEDGATRTFLGGDARLPAGVPWPKWKGTRVDFLARLSLAELHREFRIPWLPADGALLFFYDLGRRPWGYHPSHRGGCRVLHLPDLESPVETSAKSTSSLPHMRLNVSAFPSLPSSERPVRDALGLSAAELAEYDALVTEFEGDGPWHQVGGYPRPIQRDAMEWQCQLVTNGLPWTQAGFADRRAAELYAGGRDWSLLLQVDSDAKGLGTTWCDAGRLYFWVQRRKAAAGDFGDVCAILQSH